MSEHRPDLDNQDEIELMIRQFYGDVNLDPVIGPVFNDVAKVDWDLHIPKLVAFWSRALLGIQGYSGNPYAKHAAANAISPLKAAHFERWLSLFERTLDSRWSGPKTEQARALANKVANVHATQLGVPEFATVQIGRK